MDLKGSRKNAGDSFYQERTADHVADALRRRAARNRRPEQAAQIQVAFSLALRFPIVVRDVDYGGTVNLALKSDLMAYDDAYLWLANHLDDELITLDAKLGKIAEGRKGRRGRLNVGAFDQGF